MGERCVRNAEVEGSTPFRSTLTPVISQAFFVGIAAISAIRMVLGTLEALPAGTKMIVKPGIFEMTVIVDGGRVNQRGSSGREPDL